MNKRYGIQGDGRNYGTADRPIQLFVVVDHSQPNAWGQSKLISGSAERERAQELANALNAKEELAAMWAARPEGGE